MPMKSTTFDMSREDLERVAGLAMIETLNHLADSGLLSRPQIETIANSHAPLIIFRESLLERLATRIFGPKAEDGLSTFKIKIVKLPEKEA